METMEQSTNIGNENTEKASTAVEPFNVFRLCGIGRDETVHSRILAEMMNPKVHMVMTMAFFSKYY